MGGGCVSETSNIDQKFHETPLWILSFNVHSCLRPYYLRQVIGRLHAGRRLHDVFQITVVFHLGQLKMKLHKAVQVFQRYLIPATF